MLLLKVLFFIILGSICLYTWRQYRIGRGLATVIPFARTALIRRYPPERLQEKKRRLNLILGLIVVEVLLVEGILGPPQHRSIAPHAPWYFWNIHLPAALLWIGLLVAMRFGVTGDKYKELHRLAAYSSMICMAIVTVTGAFLVISL